MNKDGGLLQQISTLNFYFAFIESHLCVPVVRISVCVYVQVCVCVCVCMHVLIWMENCVTSYHDLIIVSILSIVYPELWIFMLNSN